MAVLPTSPVVFGVLIGLPEFIVFIVAISDEIAYYEIQFYKWIIKRLVDLACENYKNSQGWLMAPLMQWRIH